MERNWIGCSPGIAESEAESVFGLGRRESVIIGGGGWLVGDAGNAF